jgi:GDP/UDP-N,N'-diacetylbacillosamine 2-epimerase (hydrolysing)
LKTICIFTGTRAEYGLLKPLMQLIQEDHELKLQTLVSGMHLSPEFGLTYQEIETDGFCIDEKIEILLSSDTPTGLCKSIGLGLISFSDAFMRLKPDILVLLGDRFEALAAATTAMVARIPIAHLHGGETTEGLIDESIRHSISKMSHLHFVSTEDYRRRVTQLGEHPDRIFNFGAIGLDGLQYLQLQSKSALEQKINFQFDNNTVLITFHPVTLEECTATTQFQSLLEALDAHPAIRAIFTKANSDTDGRQINRMIDEYVAFNPQKAIAFTSMGRENYLSAMQYVRAVIGNSSSGLLEAPSFGVPTINIGSRQKGRIRAASVIDCDPNKAAISEAIAIACTDSFKTFSQTVDNPYRQEGTARRIKEIIKSTENINLKKTFYDLPANSVERHP